MVHQAFDGVQVFLQTGSAVIQRGRTEVIFGTVVSSDGYILTKASELDSMDGLSVIVDRQLYSNPKLVAEDEAWDLALIKIDASDLIPVNYSSAEAQLQGTWVIANGGTTRSRRRVQVGVVAANEREIFTKGGTVLGVQLKQDEEAKSLLVEEVTEDSGAEKAGIQKGDQIVSFEGKEVPDREALLAEMKERHVGDIVIIEVLRDEETLKFKVELAGRVELFGEQKTRNDGMSGKYSQRRSGFPRVMQHDIIGSNRFMGGPVLNLDGECVGMNIARYNRCETYAIPARELAQLAQQLIEQAEGK